MHDEYCNNCSVKRHCKKPGNVKKCSVHKNIVELLKNPVTVKPTPTVEQFEQMLAIANEALDDISFGEDAQFEYTKCENWKNPWYMEEYGDCCPVIDCGICIAKQAKFDMDNITKC